jgi:hypothetical protein
MNYSVYSKTVISDTYGEQLYTGDWFEATELATTLAGEEGHYSVVVDNDTGMVVWVDHYELPPKEQTSLDKMEAFQHEWWADNNRGQ